MTRGSRQGKQHLPTQPRATRQLAHEVQTTVRVPQTVFGKPLRRMEDRSFVTGSGPFLTDMEAPEMLHGFFVRSVYAHARIKDVDLTEAQEHPGVRLIVTAATMAGHVQEMPTSEASDEIQVTHRHPLPLDEVNFVGEPIALVVADDAASAQEASELVRVDYEPLPAVVDLEKALEPDSPKVHSYLKSNRAYRSETSSGNVRKAFREADKVVRARFEFPRLNAVPLEPRYILASYDTSGELLTAWVSTQSPHEIRNDLASILGMSEAKVRVIVPAMGGGFGQKEFYPEYAAVSFASVKLGRPVRWFETRTENLLAATQGRGQVQYVEAAVRRDGRVLGLKVRAICDGGAYGGWAISMPETTVTMSTGVYDIKAFQGEAITSFTNKTPIGAYRGASRPEASYLIERTMDIIARTMKLDPVKIRLKNFVPKNRFPYKTAGGMTYDSGDYEANLAKALQVSSYEQLRKFQREATSRGRLIGIGLITYVEVCGFGPGYPQTASVTVTENGRVIVNSGTSPHGQGHWTPFAQIVAEELGLEVEDVYVRYGDSSALPWASVTAGSRSAVVGGTAVLLATQKIKKKMGAVALKMMGLKGGKLVFRGGKIAVEGSPKATLSFRDVARASYSPRRLPKGMEPTLYEYSAYAPSNFVFPFGTHVAMVEVDRETGGVKILKYVAVDDVGKVINPMIVEGQIHGGVLQGISQALLEGIVYGEDGQLLTATLADYLIPSSVDAPSIESYRTETPSPINPMGLKGAGEAGTIAATPVIVNAVQDAISGFDKTIEKLPLTPSYIWSLMG